MLIPELYVERGETYTFIVEGGDKSVNPAKYHPFYITDSAEGGLGQASEDEQQRAHNYAGTAKDEAGYTYPTAGKLDLYHTIQIKEALKILFYLQPVVTVNGSI